MAELIEMLFGMLTRVGPRKHVLDGGTLAPPGEYDWTVRVRRRCTMMSNNFDHLLSMLQLFTCLISMFIILIVTFLGHLKKWMR